MRIKLALLTCLGLVLGTSSACVSERCAVYVGQADAKALGIRQDGDRNSLIFDQLAAKAKELGHPFRAAELMTQAARAHLAADNVNAAVERARQALLIFIRGGRVGRVPRLLERMMEALRNKGYHNQYAGGFEILHPGQKLVGRAMTAQYLPYRADLSEMVVAKEKAEAAVQVLKEKIAAGTPVSATRTLDLESLVPGEDETEAPIDGDYIPPKSVTKASPYVPGVGRSSELSKTAFVLSPGQISDVIEVRETKYSEEGEEEQGDVTGYYIIQVLGHEEPGPMLLGQQEQQMEQYWERQSQSLAFDAWIESVSQAATIKYNEEIFYPSDEIPDATEELEVS